MRRATRSPYSSGSVPFDTVMVKGRRPGKGVFPGRRGVLQWCEHDGQSLHSSAASAVRGLAPAVTWASRMIARCQAAWRFCSLIHTFPTARQPLVPGEILSHATHADLCPAPSPRRAVQFPASLAGQRVSRSVKVSRRPSSRISGFKDKIASAADPRSAVQ